MGPSVCMGSYGSYVWLVFILKAHNISSYLSQIKKDIARLPPLLNSFPCYSYWKEGDPSEDKYCVGKRHGRLQSFDHWLVMIFGPP